MQELEMLAMIWNNGPWEWIIILLVILIIFGAGKLPQVLKQMGLGVKAFKDGVNGNEDEDASANNIQYESVPEQIEAQSTLEIKTQHKQALKPLR